MLQIGRRQLRLPLLRKVSNVILGQQKEGYKPRALYLIRRVSHRVRIAIIREGRPSTKVTIASTEGWNIVKQSLPGEGSRVDHENLHRL
jgi:hypothetical protein